MTGSDDELVIRAEDWLEHYKYAVEHQLPVNFPLNLIRDLLARVKNRSNIRITNNTGYQVNLNIYDDEIILHEIDISKPTPNEEVE